MTRARLKIFFGASPGVGKTFSMLEAARRVHADGTDLVVGVVETHGRAETADLLAGLEALPRRVTTELDLEAALARAPGVILVDELAHTNAPGSRHVKRWQDVLELLDAGSDVWTTLNVQHVASLSDVVQQITGVKVREAVPDAVLDRADEIELVDVSPDELLARLAEGKVHVPDQGVRAASTFLSRGNLLSLRELALRRTAERVDADMLAYRREHGIDATWPTRDRILVGVGPSPASERLIRATKRMAEGLHAPWTAVHVELLGAPPPGQKDRERLEAHLRLVEALGGDVVRLRGHDVAGPLLEHARAHNVTRIVAGKPTHSRWRDRVRGSLLDELIRGSGPIEVHVIAPLEGEARTHPQSRGADRPAMRAYVWAAASVALVTLVGIAVIDYVTSADIAMLFLVAIMLSSLLGRGPSLLAASLAVAAYDLGFITPRYTLAVSDTHHLLTFAVMFGAGLASSTLIVRLRRQERDAVTREQHTRTLLAFTRDVATASDVADVAAVTARHVEEALDVAAAVLLPDPAEGLVAAAGLTPLAPQEASVARWSLEHGQPAGHGTDTLPDARALCLPLTDGDTAVGVLALQQRPGTPVRLDVDQRHLLDAIVRQAALAITRVQFAGQAREAALRARTEELRSSLLSAVSHDLRTPLAVITGAATTLRDADAELEAGARQELLSSIVDDARRLERVLTNLLQLTRVETGFEPAREWVPADELVGAALTRMESALADAPVELDVEHDLLLSIDPVLFEQVLINLLENALKHGAPPLAIAVHRTGAEITLEVADRGPGLPTDAARLFEKWARASTAPGVGLGLAVVRAVVAAHGGGVEASSRDGGGARFRITIPGPQPPPIVVPDASVEAHP